MRATSVLRTLAAVVLLGVVGATGPVSSSSHDSAEANATAAPLPYPSAEWPGGWRHANFGFDIAAGVTGAMATHSINPEYNTGDFVYSPTLYPGSNSCIELYDNYHDGLEIWALDWCDVSGGFHLVTHVDAAFKSAYVSSNAYTFKIVKTDVATNTWTAYIKNKNTQAWDAKYTTHGFNGGDGHGWAHFEVYTGRDASTGVGDYCTKARNHTWRASAIKVLIGGSWVNLSSSNSWPYTPSSPDDYGCPSITAVRTSANAYTVANPTLSCKVTFSTSTSGTSFTSTVSVKNTGSTTINRWTLVWDYNGGQTVTGATNAVVEQNGIRVVADNGSGNAVIAPAATATFTVTGTAPVGAANPTAFTLSNGSPCTI